MPISNTEGAIMVLAIYGFLYQSRSQASSVWETRFLVVDLESAAATARLYKLSSVHYRESPEFYSIPCENYHNNKIARLTHSSGSNSFYALISSKRNKNIHFALKTHKAYSY